MRTSRDQLTLPIAIPTWLRSRRRLSLIAGVITFSSVAAVGAAMWPYSPPSFTNGEMLSSSRMTSEFKQVGDNLTDLKTNLDAALARIKQLEDAANAEPDCPRGYAKDASVTSYTVCKKGADEMVKVGSGLEAFWVDRFESSVWRQSDGTGSQFGVTTDDFPATFPKNGQRGGSFIPLYAVSKVGAPPTASLTWFQALEACRASGKRLPSDEEWLAAASGTNDPGANDGSGGACVTMGTGPRNTGMGSTCVSFWGAQDMIGNLWELTSQWEAAPGWLGGTGNQAIASQSSWGDVTLYRQDMLVNVASSAEDGLPQRAGIPSVSNRGGAWADGTKSGTFALTLSISASNWGNSRGFRCVARAH